MGSKWQQSGTRLREAGVDEHMLARFLGISDPEAENKMEGFSPFTFDEALRITSALGGQVEDWFGL